MNKLVKKVSELMSLSLRVNTETPFCVFAWDSGHVQNVSFRITQGKEEGEFNNTLKEFNIYYESSDEYNNERINKLESYLQNLLDGNYPKVYIGKLDFGVTSISEAFDNPEARDKWVEEMKAKSKIPPEVLLSETMKREEY